MNHVRTPAGIPDKARKLAFHAAAEQASHSAGQLLRILWSKAGVEVTGARHVTLIATLSRENFR